MGPKPVAWQGPVGFSPDDRNFELFHLAVIRFLWLALILW